MRIIVSKDEMVGKLSNIQNIVEKRNTMPILSHLLLDAGKQGSSIVATDLDTALKEPLQAKVEKEGRICIPARKIFEIVREVEGEILCEAIDDQWLRVKAGASNFRLACLSAQEFPAWPGMEDVQEIALPSKVLAEIIAKAVYAAGESDTRYTLNGLLFHLLADGKATVVGTDGHRLALISRTIGGGVGEEKKLIIPRKAATELVRLVEKSDGEIKVRVGKNHVLFRIGEMEFLTRLVEGTYPNYEQVIPTGNDKKISVKREVFAKTIRRVAIMSRERSNAVRVDLGQDLLTVVSSNPDLGEATDEMAISYSGEAISLGFNAKYVLDILDAMSSENVIMEFQSSLSPVLIREEGDQDYLCVVMPMRI